MIVKELIELLQKCNPDDLVMYDASVAIAQAEEPDVPVYGIDDVLIGCGTSRGIVYLAEEPYED